MIYHKSIKYMDEMEHINFRILVTLGDRVMGIEWDKSSTLTVVFHLKKKSRGGSSGWL